ncbi:MAG: TIM barrel protein [Rhodothermales bacterium]
MDRRDFLRSGAAASALVAAPRVLTAQAPSATPAAAPFRMKFAPHFGMFTNHAGEDLIDQIKFMADQGFTAIEDNNLKRRTPEEQEAIGRELARLNMEMGVFVCYNAREASLTTGKPEFVEDLVKQLEESVEVAKRVNATWMTLVPGHTEHRLDPEFQTANIIEALKRGAEVFEPHNLVMVLEPLNHFNHPNHFVRSVPHGYNICKAVGSPAVKLLDDLYHQQVSIGNLIANMDLGWSEIAYIQIGDVPGRKEPTTGEMNYKNIFQHIHDKGYTGILGMEHGVFGEGKEGEMALIKAYREVDLS